MALQSVPSCDVFSSPVYAITSGGLLVLAMFLLCLCPHLHTGMHMVSVTARSSMASYYLEFRNSNTANKYDFSKFFMIRD
jgi:hypothetical protein